MTAFHLARQELARWLRGPLIRPLALCALLLVPTLYGATYMWTNWDPYGRMHRVPAALVNDDRSVATPDGAKVAAGQKLVESLKQRDDLDWKEVSAARAAKGLKDGKYQASLTIPAQFSADLLSPADPQGKPRQAHLTMGLNDANGYIVGKLSEASEGSLQAAVDSAAFGQYAQAALAQQAKAAQAQGGPPPDPKALAAKAEAIAQPVKIKTDNLNPAGVYGRGLSPFFFSIALWVFGLVAYEVLRPFDQRALGSRVRPWSIALGGWMPAALLAVIGAVVLYLVTDLGLGLDPKHLWATLGVMALGGAAFIAVGQLLRALWGLAGALVMLVLLMFQLTACGGLYPVETTPLPFRAIHPFLPMTYLVDGLRVTVSGGMGSHLTRDVLVLAGVLVLFLLLSTWAAARHRGWTVSRLHNPLHE